MAPAWGAASAGHGSEGNTLPEDHRDHRKRLRKQFMEQGGEGFHDHQLLELLLTYAIPRQDVNPLAHRLLDTYGSLSAVLRADPYSLMQVEGIGELSAVLLSLVGKLGPKSIFTPATGPRIRTSTDAIPLCRALVSQSKEEELWLISMNHAGRVIHTDRISRGTPTATPVYVRMVVECALRHGATAVILCHNHPTGNTAPSSLDISATQKLVKALEPLGITLCDHIIIGGNETFSFWRSLHLSGGVADNALLAAAQRKE